MERLVDAETGPGSESALGLLDEHSALQGSLQLFGEDDLSWVLHWCSRPMVATSAIACPPAKSLSLN
jgi:hypothetical protein